MDELTARHHLVLEHGTQCSFLICSLLHIRSCLLQKKRNLRLIELACQKEESSLSRERCVAPTVGMMPTAAHGAMGVPAGQVLKV